MKNWMIALAALLLTVMAVDVGAQPKKLRVGVEGAYPPFSQIDKDGTLKGFDIDIANALCGELKMECVLVQQAFDGMIPALQARKIDAVIASMSITEERRKVVEFSDRYYRTPARFVTKNGSKLDVSAAGLKGKKIGVQRSTTHDRFATDTFKGAQIVRYTKQDDVFLDLAAGRIDGALLDGIAALEGFLNTPSGKGFGFIGPSYDDSAYFGVGVGVAVRKADTALRDQLNAAIKALRTNGVYKKIQDKYFDFDVYGSATGDAPATAVTSHKATKK
jgi:arginine/ornithine transport system substrate-binding protein